MRERDLKAAQQLAHRGDYDNAYVIADRYLKDDPEDPDFMTVMVYCLLASEKTTVAYSMAKRVTQLRSSEPSGWMNLGMAANDLWRNREAERYYTRGLKLSKKDHQKSMFHVNLSSVLVDTGRFSEAKKHCTEALKLNPDSEKAKANLGFCQLAEREWKEGWANYRHCWGMEWRPRIQYNDEPEWTGTEKGTIVLQGEQGLGDEISFASMVPDMERWAKENDSSVILECEPRLESLFKRSFPNVEVHGTRRVKRINWDPSKIDYSIPSGQIGEYFRTKDSDFPGKPYLTPCPVRSAQWKEFFKSKGRPVIGIAWSGGIAKTGAKYRQWTLEQLLPLFNAVDAHWVSLQYKPSDEVKRFKEEHDVDIAEYPWATLSSDYDDTVALISALDHVVCVQTAVTHVAGALGVPCWVHVPQNSQWRYGQGTDDFVWAKSVRVIRQSKRGEWDAEIKRTGEELADFLRLPGDAEEDAREPDVRANGAAIRANGRADHRLRAD